MASEAASDFRARAREAECEAAKAAHPETRNLLQGAARRWRELAREADSAAASAEQRPR